MGMEDYTNVAAAIWSLLEDDGWEVHVPEQQEYASQATLYVETPKGRVRILVGMYEEQQDDNV